MSKEEAHIRMGFAQCKGKLRVAIKAWNTRAESQELKEAKAEAESWKLEFEQKKYALIEKQKQIDELLESHNNVQ